MKCVLEVTLEAYSGVDNPLMRLFDINNDRVYMERDEDYDAMVSSIIEGELGWEEKKEEDKNRILLRTSSEEELEQYLTETNSTIVRVRFLWNF